MTVFLNILFWPITLFLTIYHCTFITPKVNRFHELETLLSTLQINSMNNSFKNITNQKSLLLTTFFRVITLTIMFSDQARKMRRRISYISKIYAHLLGSSSIGCTRHKHRVPVHFIWLYISLRKSSKACFMVFSKLDTYSSKTDRKFSELGSVLSKCGSNPSWIRLLGKKSDPDLSCTITIYF